MPPKKRDAEKPTFKKLCYLAERLRAEDGCPWDREQTIASMLECVEEEAREVRVAIENGDHENLKEELGDVLFQIIMITQIAKEHDYFTIDDVITNIDKKIRSRHTWVFGDKSAATSEEAINLWKQNKRKEKRKK